MHKTQYDEKRLALAEAGNVDDIYDLLAAHEHKVSTGDPARAPVHGRGARCGRSAGSAPYTQAALRPPLPARGGAA